jgi:hypothetical protein
MGIRNLLRVPANRIVAFLSPRLVGKRLSFTIWRNTTTKGQNGKRNGDVEAAKKRQEFKDVYELGKTRLDLKMMINDDTITTLREQDHGIAVYEEYQKLASKFNIDLPNPPLKEKINREEKQTFFCKQIDIVEKHIFTNKPNIMGYLYKAAIQVEKSRRVLEISMSDNNHLKKYFEEVKEAAQKLDIDINEELNHLENYCKFDTEYINKIKTKLCEVKTVKRSEVDPSKIITNKYWAVSLVRKPNTLYCEHAFLVLEGKTNDKSMIWFADFVANNLTDFMLPGTRDGKVRMEQHESEIVDSQSDLLYLCGKTMMEIAQGNRLLYSTWPIPDPAAQKLIENMEKQKHDPPKYNVLGDTALAAGSATVTRNPTGHNCFTFAKMMLHDLNVEHIHVPGDEIDEWIVSAPSRYLVDNPRRRSKLQLRLFAAGVGTAFLGKIIFDFFSG